MTNADANQGGKSTMSTERETSEPTEGAATEGPGEGAETGAEKSETETKPTESDETNAG